MSELEWDLKYPCKCGTRVIKRVTNGKMSTSASEIVCPSCGENIQQYSISQVIE